jgi:hypothetical protein
MERPQARLKSEQAAQGEAKSLNENEYSAFYQAHKRFLQKG